MNKKTILITGATDGIGLVTAKELVTMGHDVLIHGRNVSKLKKTAQSLGGVKAYKADLSRMNEVAQLIRDIRSNHKKIDVLINNAGVFIAPEQLSNDGLELRFAVNTLAPYLLAKGLRPLMEASGRIVNLSSAAQSSINLDALTGKKGPLADGNAYAMSKLAITMWSVALGKEWKEPLVVAVNPRSMLGSKMVREAYGVRGSHLSVGADILCRAALSDEFADAAGKYFDNDRGIFSSPHPDALDPAQTRDLITEMDRILENLKISL